MAALVVPTIFTAVDRLSNVISKMQNSVGGFAGKTSIAVNSLNRGLNSLLPSMGGIAKQFLNMATTAAIFGGVAFSFKSLIDAEKALQSFRKQVSELDDNAFAPYKAQIQAVAEATRRSFIDVAGSFEMIALRNHDLAKTADGMALISRAGIILSKASDMEIKPATEALVDVLSQFSLGADQASRVINVLAAETKFGSATIQEQVDAYKLFLPVAKAANVTLEQSSALVGTLAKHQLRGEIAGTILKTGIIRLQKAGLGYKSGMFEINDALEQSLGIYKRLATARQKDAFLIKLFGTRGILGGKILLDNVDQFGTITKQITGTAEATRQANIYTNSLSNRLVELKNTWVNWLTGSAGAGKGLERLKGLIVYITDHLDTLVSIVIRAGEVFLGLKVAIWATQLALAAYNIVMGITGAVTGVSNIAIGESAIAMGAYKTATGLATLGNWLFGTSTAAAGTQLSLFAGEAAVAETAAAGFFATLSAFVVPAALVALGGLAIWKVLDHPKWQDGSPDALDDAKRARYSPKTPLNRFASNSEESAYQAWWLNMAKNTKDYSTIGGRPAFAKIWEQSHPADALPKFDIAAFQNSNNNNSQTGGRIDLHINDPGGHIDTGKTTTTSGIPVTLHQKSTTGNR